MKEKMIEFWRGQTFFWSACALLVFVWLPVVGSWLENLLLPVVSEFDVTEIQVTDDAVLISGRLYKPAYRAGCDFKESVATKNHSIPYVLFRSTDENSYTRSWGWSSFTNWRIPGKDITHIRLTVRHRCHEFWSNSTTLWEGDIQPVITTVQSTEKESK